MTNEEEGRRHIETPKSGLSTHNFEEWYKDQLLADARKPAREVDESQFTPKRKREAGSLYEVLSFTDEVNPFESYESERDKALRFFDDYDVYQENNLEQVERNQLFTVLERYFEG